jgi:alkylresorcinol/alkylpyrone synthase
VATCVPQHRVTTEQVSRQISTVLRRPTPRLKSQVVSSRYLAEPLDQLMLPRSQAEQTEGYLQHAAPLARDVACRALEGSGVEPAAVGIIVCVSCTGFVLPSLDAGLIPLLKLRPDTVRLPIAELGCGGGLSGLARAHDYLRAYPDRAALVVAVEVPSLTFRPIDRSPDNVAAALVFGDGAGAAVMDAAGSRSGWALLRTRSLLLPEAAGQLGYELADGGMRVILSRRLPDFIASHLQPCVSEFLTSCGLSLKDIDLVALHPGGPRVFAATQRALQIPWDSMRWSSEIFSEYANTSSAGIFFVLERLPRPAVEAYALAVAFGPGLSIELGLLRWRP